MTSHIPTAENAGEEGQADGEAGGRKDFIDLTLQDDQGSDFGKQDDQGSDF
jgi:hypothetical protein